MCRYRSQWGRILRSQVFANEGVLWRLKWFTYPATYLYHRLCRSRLCWKEAWWKQSSADLMALAWGRWIHTSDSYINCRYNDIVNCGCCNRQSARPQLQNPRALLLPGATSLRWCVCMPVILPQSSITILLLDGQSWWWRWTTRHIFGSSMVANKPMAQLVPRHWCVLAAATMLWITSSQLQPRIWSTISGSNWMMMLRRGTKIEEASRWRNQASKCSNGSFKTGLSDSRHTLMSSETVLLVSLPIRSIALCWWGCALATQAPSHCESSHCRLFG